MTRNIYLAKVEAKDTDNGIERMLAQVAITIPKNVVDEDYFVQAVQFHIFNIAVLNTAVELKEQEQKLADLEKQGKKDGIAYSKAQDKRNNLLVLGKLLKENVEALNAELAEEYESIEDVKNVFLADNFARVYAWVLGKYSARKVWKNGDEASKGKVEEIKLRFKDEDKIVSLLKDFSFSTTQEQKKQSAKQVSMFANELFATNGGEVYKKISFDFSAKKVNDELYTRFKKPLSHDGKGNIKDLENPAFDLCKQLYFMCLIQLGVPTINGQKIITVEEIADCQQVIAVARKKK